MEGISLKILILYASFGNGHKSAAFAIKNYLEKNYLDVEVNIADSYRYINRAFNKTTAKSYEFITNKTPVVWKNIYKRSDEKGMLSTMSKEMNKVSSYKLTKLINKFNPDIIVSTHMFNNNMCGRLKQKGKINSKIISIVTDFAFHSEWLINAEYIDEFYVSNEAMKLDFIKRGYSKDKIFVTGIPISPKFNSDFDKEQIRKEFELENKPTFLFFAGNNYVFNSMKDVFESLLTLNNVQIIALCGKKEKTKVFFENILNEHPNNNIVKLLSFTDKIPELMSISDFVVTKPGGLTSSEVLACNIPIIICNPIPGQEEQNSNFLLNNGVGIRLFNNDDMEITLKNFLNNKKRIEQIKEMQKSIGKPNSTKDICDLITRKN